MIRPFDAALALKNPLQIMCLQSVVPSEAYKALVYSGKHLRGVTSCI